MKTAWRVGVMITASMLLVCTVGRADPPNKQKYIIGGRALGMGGAQTAAVNDPSAVYYNPGAMVFAESAAISASQNLYSLDYRYIKGGFVPSSEEAVGADGSADAVTVENRTDPRLPSTIALMLPFGKVVGEAGELSQYRHVIGISMLVPYQDAYTLRAKWVGRGARPDEETYSLSEAYRELWTGPSYALRIAETWGIGVSAFITHSDYRRRLDVSRYDNTGAAGDPGCNLARCGYMENSESLLRISVVSLRFRLGVLFTPSDRWRVGLTVTPPGIQLGNLGLVETSGSLDQTWSGAMVTNSDTDYLDFYTDDYALKVRRRTPLSATVGAAFFNNDNMVLDVDVSVHLPTSYNRILGDPVERRYQQTPEASPAWWDPGIVRRIVKRPVVNVNVGEEMFLGEHWTFRGGVFTDFSSAPEVTYSRAPQLTRVHRFGATISAGFRNRGYDLTLGVLGSVGEGRTSRYNPLTPRQDGDGQNLYFEPTTYQERSIYVFVGGMQKAAKRMWKQARKRFTEIRSEKEKEKTGKP